MLIAAQPPHRHRTKRFFISVLTVACLFGMGVFAGMINTRPALGKEATVFAAASTRNALEAAISAFKNDTGHDITAVYAASSRLARQIINGAPADLFLSANRAWLKPIIAADFGLPTQTPTIVARNRLVLASAQAVRAAVDMTTLTDLRPLLNDGRLAIADPHSVPLGIYAKQALQSLRLWENIRPHLAPARNARQALAFVDRGAAPLGVLYESDVIKSRKTRILAVFPENSHTPIVYPVMLLKQGWKNAAAEAFLAYLKSQKGQFFFTEHGFQTP